MTQPYVVGSLVFGADAVVCDFVAAAYPVRNRGLRGAAAIGVLAADGRLAGGVVFDRWQGHDMEVSGAIGPGFRLSPADLRRVLAYAFGQAGCCRLTMHIARRNKAARRFAERLGFQVEGVKRRGWDGRQDAIAYGLLAEECRFLRR